MLFSFAALAHDARLGKACLSCKQRNAWWSSSACDCTAQVLRRVTRPAALWVHATATSSCRSVLSCKAFQADVFLGAWLEAEALQLHDKGRCRRLLHILGSVGSFAPLTGVVRVLSGMHGQRCAAFTSFLAGGHQRHMIVQTAWTAADIGS